MCFVFLFGIFLAFVSYGLCIFGKYVFPLLLGHTLKRFSDKVPKYEFGHQLDHHGPYRGNNTGIFDLSASPGPNSAKLADYKLILFVVCQSSPKHFNSGNLSQGSSMTWEPIVCAQTSLA